MHDYYSAKLAASRLQKCYDLATPRIRQYLDAEINYVLDKIKATDIVLELGCGYGRVIGPFVKRAGFAVGIDTSSESLRLARHTFQRSNDCAFFQMDAGSLGFCDNSFDLVACIQNGLSAFKIDRRMLIEESLRITRPGGTALFSSYAEKFWPDRLRWFEIQAEHDLLGEIDYDSTGNGVIICKDGFRADTIDPDEFDRLVSGLGVQYSLEEIDGSSLFCILRK